MSLKIQSRLQVNHQWPIGIIQEQVRASAWGAGSGRGIRAQGLGHLLSEARLISAQHYIVIKLFSCLPGSAFHFPSQCPKLHALTQGSMFNILGFKPEFYVPCYKHTHHHLLPLLLPDSLVVKQARGEVPSHPGGGADAGSPTLQAGQCGLLSSPVYLPGCSAKCRDLGSGQGCYLTPL